MPSPGFVVFLAVIGGVVWACMVAPFWVWTTVGLIAAVVGLMAVRSGARREAPAKSRPVVDEPSMDAIPLAVLPSTREVWAPRLAWVHWLIGGLSGFGKSNAINALMVHLCQMPDVQVYVIDPKRGVEFWPWRDRLAGIAKTKNESLAMLRFLTAELEHRMDHLRERERQRKIGHGMGFPWLVLIIDEANEILHIDTVKDRRDEAAELIESMISMGRAAGLSLILCTQRPAATSIPTGIRDNTSGARIAFRSSTPEAVDMILAKGAAKKVGDLQFLPPGVAMVWDEFTETYQRVKFQLIPDETIEYWAAATAHLAVKAAIPPLPHTPSPGRGQPRRGRRGGRRPVRSER